ncbi:MAG TPA: hypothetical protein VI583_14175 [Cyclobacteriaceae bacterium]|nr:hypothetical protein [Cyclobacteriaceae bacterium]
MKINNMRRSPSIKSLRILLIIILTGFILTNCGENPIKRMIIFTQISPDEISFDSLTGGNWRYPGKSRIVAVDRANPGKIYKILTDDFYSARAPEMSFDGTRMLFSGRRSEDSPWQIYELTLWKNKIRQVISKTENCTDPAYLPDDRIVFSSMPADEDSLSGHVLYTCGLDGCCLQRITFHPHSEFAPAMLEDGRLVVTSWQIYPATGSPMYLSYRPDGTKEELYYRSIHTGWLPGKIRETGDGQIVFVETENSSMKNGKLVSLYRGRPLSSRKELSGNIEGSFYSIFPGPDGKYIVSYSPPGENLFGIYEFDPNRGKLDQKIFEDPVFYSIDPVIAIPRQMPRNLPSEVIGEKTTGLLMCMNSDLSDTPAANDEKARFIRVTGMNGIISEIPVEKDGSFYVELTADSPIRLMTLNADGEILGGPCSWIYMRPNERRGCIGCHEDPELAPVNIVADAIKKMPVEVVIPASRHAGEGSKGHSQIDE